MSPQQMVTSRRSAIAMIAAVAMGVSVGGGSAVHAQSPSYGSGTSLPPEARAKIDAILSALPADWKTRVKANLARLYGGDSQWAEIVSSATNPDEQQCSTTELRTYVESLFEGANMDIVGALGGMGAFAVPIVDALLYSTDATPQTFGVNGEYTNSLTHAFRDLQRFWDIKSSDIQLVGMHGKDVFTDPARVAKALAFMYEIPESQALPIARDLIDLIGQEPVLQKGANPIFSFNAVAFTGKGIPDPVVSTLPDKILMGDGIMQAMAALGLADTAPKAILAHEFGHHVQFENDLAWATTPEETRRVELMADAFSTYFLTHARGQALNRKRVLGSAKSFYEVGDCDPTRPGHHGTPNQRLATATWAADLANAARPQGKILPSLTFSGMFDAKLPELVAP